MKLLITYLIFLCSISIFSPAFSQRWSYASLSKGKIGMSAGVIGDKIMFFSGETWVFGGQLVNEAELFNIHTGQSVIIPIDVSAARSGAAAATVGTKLIFAGGDNGWATNRVDIYDTLTETWSTSQLSLDRYFIAPVSLFDKAVFAGGASKSVNRFVSNVDIYDLLSDSWSVNHLPPYLGTTQFTANRSKIGAIAYGNKLYFAGGMGGDSENDACRYIHVFDPANNTWLTTLSLSNYKANICTGAYKGKIYFAGGRVTYYNSISQDYEGYPSDSMNVYDTLTGNMSTTKIPRLLYSYPSSDPAKRPWIASVQAGCKLFLIPQQTSYAGIDGQPDTIAIYDMARNSWVFEALPHQRSGVTAAACKNKVYFAGGASLTQLGVIKSDIDIYTLSPIIKTAVNNVFTGSHNFGFTEENATKQVTLQISNEGDYDLLFDPAVTYTLTGDLAAFSIDAAALPGVSDTLAPAETISIPVTFHPAAAGIYTASLTLHSNDPLTPVHTFQLSGTATEATAVRNTAAAAFINLYPNPATGTISIENTGTQVFTQLEIINPEGMTLKRETVTGALTTTDVSAIPPGMYFVRVSNDTTFTVMKLVKE